MMMTRIFWKAQETHRSGETDGGTLQGYVSTAMDHHSQRPEVDRIGEGVHRVVEGKSHMPLVPEGTTLEARLSLCLAGRGTRPTQATSQAAEAHAIYQAVADSAMRIWRAMPGYPQQVHVAGSTRCDFESALVHGCAEFLVVDTHSTTRSLCGPRWRIDCPVSRETSAKWLDSPGAGRWAIFRDQSQADGYQIRLRQGHAA